MYLQNSELCRRGVGDQVPRGDYSYPPGERWKGNCCNQAERSEFKDLRGTVAAVSSIRLEGDKWSDGRWRQSRKVEADKELCQRGATVVTQDILLQHIRHLPVGIG